MGRVLITFAPHNELGVLDHDVTLPSGETVYNRVRVIVGDAGSEVSFTLRRRPEMSDADFERDASTVAADLVRLKELMEAVRGSLLSDYVTASDPDRRGGNGAGRVGNIPIASRPTSVAIGPGSASEDSG